MELRGQSVIRIILLSVFLLCSRSLSAQELTNPRIINEDKFVRSLQRNILASMFKLFPPFRDDAKFEGYYAILIIEDGKVKDITYPEGTIESITRNRIDAIEKINEKIDLGEFEFVDIDQIIVPCIFRWIDFQINDPGFDEILKKILPKTGYTSNTYVLAPSVILTGNPKRRSN
ncbi:MAG: hypothetical protein ACI8YP_001798 [Algoriphagus sp.]|jgi:hypothetical protein|tara:strand:+ start:1064 stop:1585 length:522 start_codon:yes stop_codon:yes gene_type:complete